jgi:hypothetical protein
MTAEQGADVPAASRIEGYTGAIAERLRNMLRADLVGVYLHGSLVLGDFSEARSDVDAVSVVTRALSREEKREIGERLSQRSLPCPAGGLEFHVLRKEALVPAEAPPFELHVSTSAHGEAERVVDGRSRGGTPTWSCTSPSSAHTAAPSSVRPQAMSSRLSRGTSSYARSCANSRGRGSTPLPRTRFSTRPVPGAMRTRACSARRLRAESGRAEESETPRRSTGHSDTVEG